MLPISDLILKLENAGEVGIGIAEHKVHKDDAGVLNLTAHSPVAYVLDAVKSEKKPKKVWSSTCFFSFQKNLN